MTVDHVKKALSRIIWQYRNSPKFREWIKTIPEIAQAEIEDPADLITNILNIDQTSGAQLDIVGRIVGQPRAGYDDTTYRLLIKSRIYKNTSDTTIDSTLDAARTLSDDFSADLEDGQDRSFVIAYSQPIDSHLIDILLRFDIIPRAQGVEFTGFAVPVETRYWAGLGVTSSSTYQIEYYNLFDIEFQGQDGFLSTRLYSGSPTLSVSGDNVTAVEDESGNGNDLDQTGAMLPVIYDDWLYATQTNPITGNFGAQISNADIVINRPDGLWIESGQNLSEFTLDLRTNFVLIVEGGMSASQQQAVQSFVDDLPTLTGYDRQTEDGFTRLLEDGSSRQTEEYTTG